MVVKMAGLGLLLVLVMAATGHGGYITQLTNALYLVLLAPLIDTGIAIGSAVCDVFARVLLDALVFA